MAIMISNQVPIKDAKVISADPDGRYIALQFEVHGRQTVLVGCHADDHTDQEQHDFFMRMKDNISLPAGPTDVFLVGDFNNAPEQALDTWQKKG